MSNANVDFNFQVAEVQNANIYPATDNQTIYLNDINNGNYSNGFINFTGANLVGSSTEKQFALSEAVLHIPYTVSLKVTDASFTSDGTTVCADNAFAVGLKGSHHLIDNATIKFDGVGVTQASNFQNLYMNEKLKEKTTQEHKLYGDLMSHEWDNADSYTYNTTTATLPFESNNVIKPNVSLTNGMAPTSFYNDGHLKRCLKTNFDETDANTTYEKMIGKGGSNKHGQSVMISNTATELKFEGIAFVPLSELSDFFAKIPSTSASSGFELRLQCNIASSNKWTIGYESTDISAGPTNIHKVVSMDCVQSIGKCCTFMLSKAGHGASSGLSVKSLATPVGSKFKVEMTCTIGNQNNLACRLAIPVISYTTEYMNTILNQPSARILYNDYYIDEVLNVKGGTNVTRVLSSQISRARRLFIIPFLSTTPIGGGGTLVNPYGSPLSSAPNTSSMCRLNNLQIQIGGTNILSEQMHYNFDFYNANYLQLMSKINGNSTKSLFFSGMITKSMWEKCYGTYVFNLDKCDSEITDNQKKNITVSFKCDTNPGLYYDFIIISEFQSETFLNRALGKISASAEN